MTEQEEKIKELSEKVAKLEKEKADAKRDEEIKQFYANQLSGLGIFMKNKKRNSALEDLRKKH